MIINSIVRELKANGDMSMDYLSHNVSENLKRIRQSKGMSLDQVAEQTGVSKSMLAQIEKGTAKSIYRSAWVKSQAVCELSFKDL